MPKKKPICRTADEASTLVEDVKDWLQGIFDEEGIPAETSGLLPKAGFFLTSPILEQYQTAPPCDILLQAFRWQASKAPDPVNHEVNNWYSVYTLLGGESY